VVSDEMGHILIEKFYRVSSNVAQLLAIAHASIMFPKNKKIIFTEYPAVATKKYKKIKPPKPQKTKRYLIWLIRELCSQSDSVIKIIKLGSSNPAKHYLTRRLGQGYRIKFNR
jgi:hypothetical protein